MPLGDLVAHHNGHDLYADDEQFRLETVEGVDQLLNDGVGGWLGVYRLAQVGQARHLLGEVRHRLGRAAVDQDRDDGLEDLAVLAGDGEVGQALALSEVCLLAFEVLELAALVEINVATQGEGPVAKVGREEVDEKLIASLAGVRVLGLVAALFLDGLADVGIVETVDRGAKFVGKAGAAVALDGAE